MSILYITQNGVTDHIGRSQVAPYVLGLANAGFAMHVLSAEKEGQDSLVARYAKLFDHAGVRWTRVPYRNRPPLLGQAWTQYRMQRAAQRILREEKPRVIHCRSFPPALIAHPLKSRHDFKLIFDFRDFYADGGLAKARGPARLVFQRLKQLEGPMIRNSDKVVCLTHRATELLADWYLAGVSNARQRFQVIPCCADFGHFDPEQVSHAQRDAARRKAGLPEDAFVVLYLGSLGPDYLLEPMLALFRQTLALRPDAYFLFVSNNGKELVDAESRRQGIAADRVRFASADRQEVPAFISLAAFSVIFIRADVSKAGCSPTKLAELFACNVPVIANSGVGDLDSILDLERNGSLVVPDFSEGTLRAAVEGIVGARARVGHRIRDNSREFALEEGVERYAAVYRELLGT